MCYKFATEHYQHYPTTKLQLNFITNVDSHTGTREYAVVGVPEVFTFHGYGITNNDTAYFVPNNMPCTHEAVARAVITPYADLFRNDTHDIPNNNRVVKNGNATFIFTSLNSGLELGLCYQFGTEYASRVANFTTKVTKLHEVVQSHGDLGVAVVNYPKSYAFNGDYLNMGDKFRWAIDQDCNNPAELHENDYLNDTVSLNECHENWVGQLTHYATATNGTFTTRATTTGKNLTLCYRHHDEPWTLYRKFTLDSRMIHNFTSPIGDHNISVADQPKPITFHGDGLQQSPNRDLAKFVTASATTAADCNDPSYYATLTTPDDTPSNHMDISNGYPHTATFTFDPAVAGQWVHLCYKFDNEPFMVYPIHQSQIHHVAQLTSFVGDMDYIVAHVPEQIAVHGEYVTSDDYGRWIKGTGLGLDEDCDDADLILLSDDIATDAWQTNTEEPIFVNDTTHNTSPHLGRETIFRFNFTYQGETPIYCHKFKNEPYKIYPTITTKIGHVDFVSVNVGDTDVAVIDYEKTFTFHGGHITSADRVKWSLTSAPVGVEVGCETAVLIQHHSLSQLEAAGKLPDGGLADGYNTTSMVQTDAASFNFTAVNSGDQVRLCYKFNNEPYRTYPEMILNLHMLHNKTTPTLGEHNRSVVDVPKPLHFHGHNLHPDDRAKWLIKPMHYRDCNDAGKTAALRAPDTDYTDHSMNISDLPTAAGALGANFTFDPQAAGYWVALCYKFKNEPYQIYYQHRSQVNMLQSITSTLGDVDVAVVDYPKTLRFTGRFLAAEDKFKWVSGADHAAEGDACLVPSSIHPNAKTEADNATVLDDHTVTLPPNNTVMVDASTTEGTFTMKDTSSGRNNTLCYKHRGEPWKMYEIYKHDVRMIHSITSDIGSYNDTVVDQTKTLAFHGDGLDAGFHDGARTQLHDRVKWIKRASLHHPLDVNYKQGLTGYVDGTLVNQYVSYNDCNNMTHDTAPQNNVTNNMFADQDNINTYDKGDHSSETYTNTTEYPTAPTAKFNFDTSAGGYVLLLCYKFENEPYMLYTEHHTRVHQVRNISSYQGGVDIIVADVAERLAIHGDFVTTQDKVRWVSNGHLDEHCERDILESYWRNTPPRDDVPYKFMPDVNSGFVSYGLPARNNFSYYQHEPITGNWTNTETIYDGTSYTGDPWSKSNSSHEATFWFNGTYSGLTPVMCHKFKDEPWKIYPNITIKVARIDEVLVGEGDANKATVNYQKKWQFNGGHVSNLDRMKWVITNDTDPTTCEGGIFNQDFEPGWSENVSLPAVVDSRTAKATPGYVTKFNFTDDSAGLYAKLCYKFNNEPYHAYLNFPLEIKMIQARSVSFGSTNQVVPSLKKFFFYAGQGLCKDPTSFDTLKWIKWGLDCNDPKSTGEPLFGGKNTLDVSETSVDANDIPLTAQVYASMKGSGTREGGYTEATFIDRTSGGPLQLCYAFQNEPFMTYYDMLVTVTGIAEVRSDFGDPFVLVLDMVKDFNFVGFGVSSNDRAFWVKEDATTDEHCKSDSNYLTPFSSTVIAEDGVDWSVGTFNVPISSGYEGQTLKLCYTFNKENPKFYPDITLTLKGFGELRAVVGSNVTAVVGVLKRFDLIGGQIAAGDQAKYVSSVTTDADCEQPGLNTSSVVYGYGSNNRVEFDFTVPSADEQSWSLCYKFQNEPYKLYSEYAIRVNELGKVTGMIESHAMTNAPQKIDFIGSGVTELDKAKFVTAADAATSCDASLPAAGSDSYSVVENSVTATFTESAEGLVLCYKFGYEPYAPYPAYTITPLAPEIASASVSDIVVGQSKLVKMRGTFGVTTADAIKFVPNDASDCETHTGEGSDNDSRATVVFTPSNLTRSSVTTTPADMAGGTAFFTLETADGVEDTEPILLCYRFGPVGTIYSFFPSLSIVSREIEYISVNMEHLSTIGTEVEFEFHGAGLNYMDTAKFIDAGSVDGDCSSAAAVGGSVEQQVMSNKAKFTFTSGFSSIILCYQFGTGSETEAFKIYSELKVVDTALKDVEVAEIFYEAPAKVALSLAGSVDTIPEGSPARTTFEANFKADITAALGIDQSRVTIIDIISGSIIVIFEIKVTSNSAEPLVSELVSELVAQMTNPNSTLNSGTVTSEVNADVVPVVSFSEPVAIVASSAVSSGSVNVVSYQRMGMFQFQMDEFYSTEGSGTAVLTVERSMGNYGQIVLKYGTIAGTASAGSDFVSVTEGSLVFASGETSKTIHIELVDDAVKESHYETFLVWMKIDSYKTSVYHSQGFAAEMGTRNNATVRVYDWGEGGSVVANTEWANDGEKQGWSVVGNEADDLFVKEENMEWVDQWGFQSSDLRYGDEEYNEQCDYAAPLTPCGYSCQYGDRALANKETGEPSTVLSLDGTGYIASVVPFDNGFTDTFTIGLWVRGSSLSDTPDGTLYSYTGNSTENQDGLGFHEVLLSNHRDLSLMIRDRVVSANERYDGFGEGDRRGLKLGVNLADDQWHHVTVTWRSLDGRVKCWVDGALVFDGGPYKVGELVQTGGSSVLGMTQDGGCSYDGTGVLTGCVLDETSGFVGQMQSFVTMKNYADQEAATLLMKIPLTVNMDNVLFLWYFQISSTAGRVVSDSSGQGQSMYSGGNRGYASSSGSRLVVGTPKSLEPVYPCGEIYKNIWHFLAGGDDWSGDLSSSYGGRLQFKMMASSHNGNVRNGRGSVVIIATDGTTITYKRQFGSPGERGVGAWNYYAVVMREDHGWYTEPGGVLVAGSEMKRILGIVDKILIRGDDFVYGGEGNGQEIVGINSATLFSK